MKSGANSWGRAEESLLMISLFEWDGGGIRIISPLTQEFSRIFPLAGKDASFGARDMFSSWQAGRETGESCLRDSMEQLSSPRSDETKGSIDQIEIAVSPANVEHDLSFQRFGIGPALLWPETK